MCFVDHVFDKGDFGQRGSSCSGVSVRGSVWHCFAVGTGFRRVQTGQSLLVHQMIMFDPFNLLWSYPSCGRGGGRGGCSARMPLHDKGQIFNGFGIPGTSSLILESIVVRGRGSGCFEGQFQQPIITHQSSARGSSFVGMGGESAVVIFHV